MDFDREEEKEVERYINTNQIKVNTFLRSDPNRLTGENLIDTLITHEVKAAMRSFQEQQSRETNINKMILKNTPGRAIKKLQILFNHTLSLGYFPTKFKTALIKILPKHNTNTKDPKNYRPISLLEVPGKILEKIIHKTTRISRD